MKDQARHFAGRRSRKRELYIRNAREELVLRLREQRRFRLARGLRLQATLLERDRDRDLRRELILADITPQHRLGDRDLRPLDRGTVPARRGFRERIPFIRALDAPTQLVGDRATLIRVRHDDQAVSLDLVRHHGRAESPLGTALREVPALTHLLAVSYTHLTLPTS